MHLLQFSLISLIFCGCCGIAAAQQNVLVLKDEKDDPCSRFKMRILMPADRGDYKLRVQKPADDIDLKMVWNPCPKEDLSIARLNLVPGPDYRGKFFVKPPFKVEPIEPDQSKSQKQLEGPKLPSAIEMMRRRKQ